jgi:uncharacterized protein
MSSPVTHLEILGPDRAALSAFYGTVFGWKLEPIDEMNYTLFHAAEGGIGGGIGRPEDGSPAVSLYAVVEDLDATLARAKELGSTNTMGPILLSEDSRIGMFRDPAGNVFGAYQGPDSDGPTTGTGAPVSWFDIIGGPADAQRDFYSELLGWEYEMSAEYAHIKATPPGIGGGISAPHPGQPERALVAYMTVSNIEETLAAIEEAGGKTVMGRMSVGEGVDIAWFTDVAGNLNGLAQMGQRPS